MNNDSPVCALGSWHDLNLLSLKFSFASNLVHFEFGICFLQAQGLVEPEFTPLEPVLPQTLFSQELERLRRLRNTGFL